MLKMYTYKGNWVVVDGDRHVAFDTAMDAWMFVMLLKDQTESAAGSEITLPGAQP